jgi:uncharacterized alpha/beta hydrolase family protein
MKKFIFALNVILIVALVPAVVFGYLQSNTQNTDTKQNTEIVKEVNNSQNEGFTLRLVKIF